MDPNLFHLDWERTLEAVMGIVVLSFLVERACSLLFESRFWIRLLDDARVGTSPEGPPGAAAGAGSSPAGSGGQAVAERRAGRNYPLKELISFCVAAVICWGWGFDAVSIILLSEKTHPVGTLVTAAVVAGGSKGSVALFHSLLRVKSSAETERQALKDRDRQA